MARLNVVDIETLDEHLDMYLRARLQLLPLHWMEDGACSCGQTCASPGKHPLLKHGKDDASFKRVDVNAWRKKWPLCNIGARPAVGTFVLDVDPRHNGDLRLAELMQDHGQLPYTLTAITGGSGLHFWFRLAGALRGKICAGLDIKTNSGYVVLPPSNHELGDYEWIDLRPVQPAPHWLAKRLLPERGEFSTPKCEGGVEILVAWLLKQEPGGRNHALYWACRESRDSGYDPNPLVEAAVSIGLSRKEAEATAASAFRGTSGGR